MPKKVGTITLEYDRGDGVAISEAFQGEFNNAIFRGDISSMEGTFQGTLTAKAVNAVKNLNIKGGAIAVTSSSSVDRVHGIFDDDGVYRTVHSHTFGTNEPSADEHIWMSAGIQYTIDDQKRDNDRFQTQYRILLDGLVIYETPNSTMFVNYYTIYKHFHYSIVKAITPGVHTIALQFRWFDYSTNVYPDFRDVVFRVDYIRK